MTKVKRKQLPTVDRLRQAFAYDQETGALTWRISRPGPIRALFAGSVVRAKGQNFLRVSIDGARYQVTHVIWKWMTGDEPVHEIDHRDKNSLNNAWLNLRQATDRQNTCNRNGWGKTGKGFKGVTPRYFEGKEYAKMKPSERPIRAWRARIRHHGKLISLGEFPSRTAAYEAYKGATTEYHDVFASAK